MHPATDPNDIDIYSIDFNWIKQTTSLRLLKKAKRILDDNGSSHYPDLYKALVDKLSEVDPKQNNQQQEYFYYKKINQQIDKEIKQAEEELADWELSMKKQVRVQKEQLDGQEQEVEKLKMKNQNKEIFKQQEAMEKIIEPEIEEIPQTQTKIMAENEKNKGNEALRAIDFDEAIQCYTKSLSFDPTFAISYSNRALAYLQQKKSLNYLKQLVLDYDQAINDSNNSIKYQPDYLKAYYRRGQAYMAQKRYSKALEDFQYIMVKEPTNQEVNAELKEARKQLEKQTEQENQNKFTRVQIVEEEDSDEEEPQKTEENEKKEQSDKEKKDSTKENQMSKKKIKQKKAKGARKNKILNSKALLFNKNNNKTQFK